MSIISSRWGPYERTIVVQTREENEISNAQSLSISPFVKSQFPNIEREFPDAKFRSKPTGIYNCHGLTFSSRRTGIHEAQEVHKILADDNYKEVPLEEVLPGDIILYFSEGDIEHSGVVISKPDPQLKLPKVYSKWGSYCEAIHYANRCPYDFSNARYYRVLE